MSNASEMPSGGICQTTATDVFDSIDLEPFDEEAYAEVNPSATHLEKMLATNMHNRLMVDAEFAAKQKCGACPVRDACLEWALGIENGYDVDVLTLAEGDELPVLIYGVVGGLNQQERGALSLVRQQQAEEEAELEKANASSSPVKCLF